MINLSIKKVGVWIILTLTILSYSLIWLSYEDKYLGWLSSPPQKLSVKSGYPLNLWLVNHYKNQNKTAIIYPIGRSSLIDSNVKYSLNNEEINLSILTGPCGGYWVNLSLEMISSDSIFSIHRTLSPGCTTFYHEENINRSAWIKSSLYIDSDEIIIRQVATNLTGSKTSVSEKAQAINSFVHEYIEYSNDPELDENASQTYLSRKGRCRHFARLFVALCRSVDIPARTISGRLLTDTSPYADYHLWTEFYDENNHWVPADPTHGYFNFSNTRFLDLSFAKDQHPFNSSEAFFSNASTLIGGYGQIKITAVSFSAQNLFELGFLLSAFSLISAGLSYIPIEIPSILNKLIEKRSKGEE